MGQFWASFYITISIFIAGTYLRIYRHLFVVEDERDLRGRGLRSTWNQIIVRCNKSSPCYYHFCDPKYPHRGAAKGSGSSLEASFFGIRMGGALSHFFQSGHALLSSSHNRAVSEQTKRNIRIVFDALCANPKVSVVKLYCDCHC